MLRELHHSALVIIALAVMVGCNTHEAATPLDRTLTFRDSTLTVMADTCTDSSCGVEDCGGISIDRVIAQGDSAVASRINTVLASTYLAALGGPNPDAPQFASIGEAVSNFLSQQAAFRKDVPESPGGNWTFMARDSIFRSDSIVCIRQLAYSFTGGAHGNTVVAMPAFLATTGERITWRDLTTDTNAFIAAAERAFRRTTQMSTRDTYAKAGFWFENERFTLPNVIGIMPTGYVLVYNQYEVAPYAYGVIEVPLPFDSVATTQKSSK
jgi:hypothetical protein